MSQLITLFDSHCHLDAEQFDADRDAVIRALPGFGIVACLTCGSDIATSKAAIALAEQYPFVYAAAGIHPHEVAKASFDELDEVEALLSHPKVVALGEIGLDHYYDFSPRGLQEEFLVLQLQIAKKHNKPVILHVREAHGAMIDLLTQHKDSLPKGVLHCYSGSAESVAVYEKLGFHISFAGSLTFKNTQKLRLAAEAVSSDRLLIETDSPYLAPVPHRGKRNHPGLVGEVCRLLADIRGMSAEDLAALTCRNACALFGLDAQNICPPAL